MSVNSSLQRQNIYIYTPTHAHIHKLKYLVIHNVLFMSAHLPLKMLKQKYMYLQLMNMLFTLHLLVTHKLC